MPHANGPHTGYRIKFEKPADSQIPNSERSRLFRLFTCLLSSAAVILAPVLLFGYLGKVFGYETVGSFIGIAAGFWLLSFVTPRMFIYNPEWAGYVTQDPLFGTMVPYGPGFHLSHWWEQRNASGNYSLKVITRPFSVSIPTRTSKVVVNGEYGYAISLPEITRTVGVDETTIEGGLTAFTGSFLSQECAKGPAEEVRAGVGDLNKKLSTEFMGHAGSNSDHPDSVPKLFEKTYGFKTVSVVIVNIELPEAVQKTRDAIDEAEKLHEVMAKLLGIDLGELARMKKSKEISDKDYQNLLNRAMAISDNATMDIQVIEGDVAAAIANLVGGQSGKGGRS